jgi:mRNA-degrading endonuclease RelE of RelBE toxin-antitoxin system
VYRIDFAVGVVRDLAELRAYDRQRLLHRIELQLSHQPLEMTRNRKPLLGLESPWDQEEPIWELRVGTYRVFYDVEESERRVIVRAVRRKLPGNTTEDVL